MNFIKDLEFDEKNVLAVQDLSDEDRIQFAIMNFYKLASSINDDNYDDVWEKMVAHCNVILTMMHVYLSKFNNSLIMADYSESMTKLLNEIVDENESCDPFFLCLALVRTVGVYLGIRENFSEKLAEQLFDQWKCGVIE